MSDPMPPVDPDDPEVVACDGPTLRELQDASIDVMLEPFRARLEELAAEIIRDMVDELVTLRGIAGRLRDGWEPKRPGTVMGLLWHHPDRGYDHMTDAERQAIYGEVVTGEGDAPGETGMEEKTGGD